MSSQLLLSRSEAAEALGIGVTTLWRLTREGKLRPIKVRGRSLFLVEEIQTFLRTQIHDRDGRSI